MDLDIITQTECHKMIIITINIIIASADGVTFFLLCVCVLVSLTIGYF